MKAIGGGAPAGTVTFNDGTATLGTGALDASGIASFTASSLALGTYPITAVYGGDGSFSGRTSDALAQAVPTATGCGTPGFFPTAGSPVAVGVPVAGDFNLDGEPDLAVVNSSHNSVTILLGVGAGGLVAARPAAPLRRRRQLRRSRGHRGGLQRRRESRPPGPREPERIS